MRGWGSSFALWLVGALLLWAGVVLIESAGVGAIVLLAPGALMFAMGANALYGRRRRERDFKPCPQLAPPQATVIPFPRSLR